MGSKPSWRRRLWPIALGLGLLLLLGGLLPLAPFLGNSMELVRLRNAWMLSPSEPAYFEWTPQNRPVSFLQEERDADPLYRQLAQELKLEAQPSDWQRALLISDRLLSNPHLDGPPIQADLVTSYHRIVEQGDGYCGDFTRVFTGLALAAGMQVRNWSFSLDGFGGHGHIWPEIWNRQRQRWEMLDLYNNVYFHLGDGLPLSAMELRQALKAHDLRLRSRPLVSHARPGYALEPKLWDYYRSGLEGWYLHWGNDVFSMDRVLRPLPQGRWARPLQQVLVIASGSYPPIKVIADGGNENEIEALTRLKVRLHWQVRALLAGAALLLLALALRGRRGKSGTRSATA